MKSEIEAQRQAERAHATEEIDLLRGCSGSRERPRGLDKSCQADHAPYTCGIDSADSTADEANVMAPASAMAKAESKRRFEAAVATASAAEAAATSWAHAFSSGTEVIHAALVALCEHANNLLGAGSDERKTPVVPLLEGTETTGCSPPGGQESSAVVPWVPGEVGTEAETALDGLRDSVESAVKDIRLALTEHAALAVARAVPPPVAAVVSLATTESQTDSVGSRRRESLEHERRTVGVQVVSLKGGREEGMPCAGGAGGAPAWEVGSTGRCPEQQNRDDGGERQRQARDVILVEELTRKSSALSEALQRAEGEKVKLERSLRKHFEREKVVLWVGVLRSPQRRLYIEGRLVRRRKAVPAFSNTRRQRDPCAVQCHRDVAGCVLYRARPEWPSKQSVWTAWAKFPSAMYLAVPYVLL